jgi:micrococcal nuclease
MIKKLFPLHLLLFVIFLGSFAEAWTLKSCHDGDTCSFVNQGETKYVRFVGIDAPEIDQPFGTDAQEFTESLLKNKEVFIKCTGTSYYRATCSLAVKGDDVEDQIVKRGLAMDSPRYSGGKYAKSQEFAKQNRLGMWADPTISSPFCWRWKENKTCKKDKLFQP